MKKFTVAICASKSRSAPRLAISYSPIYIAGINNTSEYLRGAAHSVPLLSSPTFESITNQSTTTRSQHRILTMPDWQSMNPWAVRSSNKILEVGPEDFVAPPDPSLVTTLKGDPTKLYNRIGELQTPNERLCLLLKSLFNPIEEPTHEAYAIRSMVICGAFVGLVFGGILRSPQAHDDYIRLHNASVFDNKHAARRHYYDSFINTVVRRGIDFGFKLSLLAGSAGIITYGSIAYRDKLYLPDWLIGFGTLGGVSRLWLGSRAVAAGAVIGATGGLIGFGIAKGMESFSGSTATQLRQLNHDRWARNQASVMRRAQIWGEQKTLDYLEDAKEGAPRIN